LLAHGVLVSGMVANRIFFEAAKLTDFQIEILGIVPMLLLVVLTPLLVFAPQLNRAKRTGLLEYGILAQRYVSEFDQKWLRGNPEEALIGNSDIQSLADLGNSFQVIREMRVVPFTKETILQLAIVILTPVIPLLLTMFSVNELIERVLKIVF